MEENSIPEIIYHYTTADGLNSIISEGKLRATDIEYFNDAKELIYARDAVFEEISKINTALINTVELPYDPKREEFLRVGVITMIGALLNRLGGHEFNNFPTYVSCFCEQGDLLSQWRAYGKNGGYAIGFDSKLLLEGGADLQLRKITYGLENAEKDIEVALGEIGKIYGHPGDTVMTAKDPGQTAVNEFAKIIIPLLAGIKHPSFSEEKEWRLIQSPSGDGWRIDNVNFRASDTMGFVPYIDIDFPKNAVRKIVIGPGGERGLKMNAIRWLLNKSYMGTYVPGLNETIETIFSDAPLRR